MCTNVINGNVIICNVIEMEFIYHSIFSFVTSLQLFTLNSAKSNARQLILYLPKINKRIYLVLIYTYIQLISASETLHSQKYMSIYEFLFWFFYLIGMICPRCKDYDRKMKAKLFQLSEVGMIARN